MRYLPRVPSYSIEEAVLMGDRVVVLKGRPSSVFEVIDVGLPHPRNRDTLASQRFAEVREHVWSNLMDEARKAEVIENARADADRRGLPAEQLARIWDDLVETSIAYELVEWDRIRT